MVILQIMDFKKGGKKKNPERSLPKAKKMNGTHGLHPCQGRQVLQTRGREEVEEPRKMIVLLGGSRGVRWIIIHSASADLSADMLENRFIKLKILLKHSRML